MVFQSLWFDVEVTLFPAFIISKLKLFFAHTVKLFIRSRVIWPV